MLFQFYVLGASVLFAQAFPAVAQMSAPVLAPQLAPQSAQQSTQMLARPADQAPATPAEPLTLKQAVDKALTANPALRAAAFDAEIVNGQRRQAGLFPNPELAVVREGTQRGFRTETLQLSQVLELGGKRAARIDLAERERSLVAGKLDVARMDLRAELTTAYFDALAAQERVRLAQASLDVASKASGAASKRVAAGRASPVETDRAGVAQALAGIELSRAQTELSEALRGLAAFWGDIGPARHSLVIPEIDPAPPAYLDELEAGLDTSPQLSRARLQVEREEAQVRVDLSQRSPDLTLIVGRKKDDEIGRSQTVLGLSVPLPLFNRNQGAVQASLARAEQARAELEVERLRLRQGLVRAHQRAQLSREQLHRMDEEILPAAQRIFDSTVTGFDAGKFSFLDVLDAQRTLLQIRIQYIQALHERFRAAADLGRYVNADAGATQNRISP
jgi:cobalt-zinc-cadmium efflux system outer membrane protein